MKSIEINAKLRSEIGKKATKKLRKEDNVPCVLYGEKEPIHFFAHENEFRKLVYTPNVYWVKLKIEGKEYSVIMQDIQFHPVTDRILHIDFLEISEDKPFKMVIPVIVGFAKSPDADGGKVTTY